MLHLVASPASCSPSLVKSQKLVRLILAIENLVKINELVMAHCT